MKVLDLFSGIGGFSLGLERAGMETVAFCEYDEPCRKVLRKHWPDVPIWGDIHSVDLIDNVDVICGGFPCQPFSSAARGRHSAIDLWPEMSRVVQNVLPQYVIAENVTERAIDAAKSDLERAGYAVWKRRIDASFAGADHQRKRWWLCAYSNCESELHRTLNAEVARLPELCQGVWSGANYARALRIPDGASNRMDRLKQLGNTVIPQIPETIGRAILEIEHATN